MSIPTRELGNLSIGRGMPVNRRADGQQLRRRRERQALERSTATASQFTVDRAERKEPRNGYPYYAFQLKHPVSVRIYGHQTQRPEPGVTCTCDEFTNRHIPCAHIFWLFDGLNHAISDTSRSRTPQLVTNENVLQQISNLYQNLGEHLDPANNDGSLISRLNETRVGEDVEESDDNGSDNELQPGVHEYTERVVQDMLYVFNERILPGEFDRHGLITDIPTEITSPKELVNSKDLFKTIYGLALHDREFRTALRKTINKDFCAESVLEKIQIRIKSAFERIDARPEQGQRPDLGIINEVADGLREIDGYVQRYFTDRAPLSLEVRKKAAGVVVDLLTEVCDRTVDTFGRARNPRNKTERILFFNLIGETAADDDLFILQFLDSLAPPAWLHLLGELETIVKKLQENQAPRVFIDELRRIIESSDNHHTDPTRVTAERPSPVGEPPARRRRLV